MTAVKTVVADTSALISLALSGEWANILEVVAIVVPSAVKSELQDLSSHSDSLARAAKAVLSSLESNRIRCISVRGRHLVQSRQNKDVDAGESECFQLAVEQSISILLMDDVPASAALYSEALAQKIAIRISAAAIVELVRQKKISPPQAEKSLHRMIAHRGWEKSVLAHLIGQFIQKGRSKP